MDGVAEQRLDPRLLHHLAVAHHDGAVAGLGHHAEVVGDEQHREAEVRPQVLQQLQDLRLQRHVERRRRLVGQQQVRRAGERHGDHRPLALAAGELVRIVGQTAAGVRQGHALEQPHGLVARLPPRQRTVRPHGLDDLEADRVDGIERRGRFLEDHADAAAAHPAHLALGEGQQIGRPAGTFQPHAARRHPARRRHQAEHGEGGEALARAGLPHQADELAAPHGQRHAAHHRRPLAADGKGDLEILDREERLSHRPLARRFRTGLAKRRFSEANRPLGDVSIARCGSAGHAGHGRSAPCFIRPAAGASARPRRRRSRWRRPGYCRSRA